MKTVAKQRGPMNNSFDPSTLAELSVTEQKLIKHREDVLGPAYRLFYKKPIHLVRGKGTRLWDAHGKEYLDAYNNVVTVGHAHPYVVEAVHRQMQTICTNTRYLHEGILRYAQELLATFAVPVADGQVMFTCTGSEANDLALRIAKYHTGNEGIIVTSEAYHGNSHQTARISPSLGDRAPLSAWVRPVPSPDSYRIDKAELSDRFAGWVAEQIRDLERHGQGLAALVVDTAFSSDGIYFEPRELLQPALELVHAAGGLFIADEVQPGFGRLGSHLWGHQRHDVDPDIVSLGKPMGNGFPVAGIVVRSDAVAEFGYAVRYFNTFGGNTVAIAAAQATLDVILDEGLLANAEAVGVILRNGLIELQQRYERIGDVRGAGLYLGVEFVTDRDSKSPDGAIATAIVNAMAERGVLIGATGRVGNILKIRPPLVFSARDADRLLTELESVLAGQPARAA